MTVDRTPDFEHDDDPTGGLPDDLARVLRDQIEPMTNRSDQYGKGHRSPDLRPGDLTRGLDWLRTHADQGSPSARAVLEELDRLRAERRLIRRGAVSVGGTHEWTGRRWRERA